MKVKTNMDRVTHLTNTRAAGQGAIPISVWAETAAQAIYMLACPDDLTLPWDFLTRGQQDRYRKLVNMAVRSTTATAMRAAQERGAGGISSHSGRALSQCSYPERRAFRFQAMDCVRAYEDHLMNGDETTDALYLQLQADELRANINALHERALTEDALETTRARSRVQARQDITKYGCEGDVLGESRR